MNFFTYYYRMFSVVVVVLISGSIFILANWLLYRRLRTFIWGVFAVIFTFTWVLISAVYIDASGGVYAKELFRTIGGGFLSVILALIYFVFVMGVLLVFSQTRTNNLLKATEFFVHTAAKPSIIRLRALAIIVLGVFIIVLYMKLFENPIPFIIGIHRYIYKVEYGSFPLSILYKYISFISLFTGALFYYEARARKNTQYLVLAMFLSILIYLFLIGNKFSQPFYSVCLFAIPVSLLKLGSNRYNNADLQKQNPASVHRLWLFGTAGFMCVVFVVSLHHSYFTLDVGGREEVYRRVMQRVFVQQAQLWWSSSERVYMDNDWKPDEAFYMVFTGSIFPTDVNTSVLYLMYRHIGLRRTLFCFERGNLYTGAYPTILLELLGPFGVYFGVFIFAIVFAGVLYLFLRAIVQHHYLSVFFVAFIFQPFLFFHVGGKLVFFVRWQFWVKMILMLAAVFYENRDIIWRFVFVPGRSKNQIAIRRS